MRKAWIVAAAGLLVALPLMVHAATFEIDSAHTSAQFAVKHLMVSTVRGTLGKVSGTANVDESDLAKSSVEATIDVKGVDTREEKRDNHLRGPDFFDADNHPTIHFKSTKVETLGGDKFNIAGDLTIRGITKPVVLAVEGSPKPFKDPFGNERMGGVARARINRKDFGMAFSKTMDNGGVVVADDVDITIDLELTRRK
ncbi:MAG: polyisoprenoid-binding protein [Deltaproteobacteria bacterium]|nr:polyisoprenoid-binding protein [Deltaproteobacteria bacterium]